MAKTFVFKFGGASVKDAASIKNLYEIVFNRLRNNTIIVVSAMGKTTNALEDILALKLAGKDYSLNSTKLLDYHLNVCEELFDGNSMIFPAVRNYFSQLDRILEGDLTKGNYDEFYDSVVSFGELLSSRIVQEYLCSKGLYYIWQDAREIILTNSDFRFAKVDWESTGKLCQKLLAPKLTQFPVVTQGFIGADEKGRTTTLGREGSDFTAAILAHGMRANAVTIWKDVDGVLNADPKRFPDAVKFDELDYKEAAELTFYGASVIHPKTIKPLANLSIPLYVKSFIHPEGLGTKIHHVQGVNTVPCIVVKDDQILVSFRVTDFTFINESHIHSVYSQLEELKLRVNLLQISAISISIVIEKELFKLEKLINMLRSQFEIRYNESLQLITVKNHHQALMEKLTHNKEILLEQMTRTTFQVLVKNHSQ
ncbi:aspartate kinase [Aquiflexum balticum DSM 16537]|uniref:Aspartokinase n=1 Tax=Aquiflexum balticum DSM 16537 TaxID=758820 RepID=A0A1W2H079_9BACT|nr:aspartate kinase [Aquiflexum balticum]SMD41896.1 aspartate kinase [Aquiflexum balticum DSM 16537]